jgi:aspartate racemase
VSRLVPYAGGLAAHTTHGVVHARRVVVATGAFHVPFLPAVDGSFSVPALHSSEYRRPSDLPAGRVLVVGGANSGLQLAEELAGDHEVVLASGSNPPSVSQRPLGHDLFWWLTSLGLMDKGPDSRLAKRMRARGDLVVGTSRKALRKAGVDFRPRLVAASGRTATFADGSSVDVDSVVWATGFRPDYSWIDAPWLIDGGGMPRHDGGRSLAVPGLWFLGLPWQRTRGSALLGYVQRDAARLAAQMFDGAPIRRPVPELTVGRPPGPGLSTCPALRHTMRAFETSPDQQRRHRSGGASRREHRIHRIGLIGGMSWESSALYYRLLNQGIATRLGGSHSAECVLYSVDFAEIEAMQSSGRWADAGGRLAQAAQSLEAAGADFVLIGTDTMHKVYDDVQAAVSIPLLHLGDATAAAVRAANLTRVGLLGTAFTMEQTFYRDRLEQHGLTVFVPGQQDRQRVHGVIYDELCHGIVRPESRAAYRDFIGRLVDEGAQGIILGCTEIELLISQQDSPVPVFPTTQIHVDAALDRALTAPNT